MPIKPKITLKESGPGLSQLRRVLNKTAGLTSAVGILGVTVEREGSMSNAEIGLVHEFGSSDGRIPERSFLRSTFEAQRENLERLSARAAEKLYSEDMKPEQALGQLGAFLAAEVKKTIVNRIAPPLAAATIARKGSDVPLVDTGQLLNSITWEIRKAK